NVEHGTADLRERDTLLADHELARCKPAAAVGVAHHLEKQLPCERHVAPEPRLERMLQGDGFGAVGRLRELRFAELGGKEAGQAPRIRDARVEPRSDPRGRDVAVDTDDVLGHSGDERRPRLERQRQDNEAFDVPWMERSVDGRHEPAEAAADESDAAHALAMPYA